VFTGLRPGERLHEQLTAPDEETVATAISKVRIVLTPRDDILDVGRLLQRFEQMLNAGDEGGALLQLKRQFPQLRFTVPPNASDEVSAYARREQIGGTALAFRKRPGPP
jgi:FlaA1/EpsC-like NDP-sugar epimerase